MVEFRNTWEHEMPHSRTVQNASNPSLVPLTLRLHYRRKPILAKILLPLSAIADPFRVVGKEPRGKLNKSLIIKTIEHCVKFRIGANLLVLSGMGGTPKRKFFFGL